MSGKKLTFERKNDTEFYQVLRERVDKYFADKKISKHANAAMVGKTIFILSVYVSSYLLLLSNLFDFWGLLLLAAINGFFTALIGLNIAHDAIHGAYSASPKLNKLLGTSFNIIGANDYMWKIKHNIIHHTFTNIPEHDDDINQLPLLRMKPEQDLWWVHRFQHIYVFLLYPFSTLTWVFINDYVKFFQPQFGWYKTDNHPKIELFRLFFFKAVYYVFFLIVPFVVIDLPWYYILVLFVVLHLVEGITLSFIFQLAHVVEGISFPKPDETGKIHNAWAIHQMYTTADFARNNPLVNFLFGGLNFQIEHHLFPKVCHIHYRQISLIVEETAKEFNLPYIENKTFFGAVLSHLRMMKKLGAPAPKTAVA